MAVWAAFPLEVAVWAAFPLEVAVWAAFPLEVAVWAAFPLGSWSSALEALCIPLLTPTGHTYSREAAEVNNQGWGLGSTISAMILHLHLLPNHLIFSRVRAISSSRYPPGLPTQSNFPKVRHWPFHTSPQKT